MGNTTLRVGRRCPESGIDCNGIGAQGGEKSPFTDEERLLMKERLLSSPEEGVRYVLGHKDLPWLGKRFERWVMENPLLLRCPGKNFIIAHEQYMYNA